MKIFMTIPALSRHGGLRVILEWANRLSRKFHLFLRVQSGPLECDWFPILPTVRLVDNDDKLGRSDLLIVTSPHGDKYLARPNPFKKVVFLQMMEDLFFPSSVHWRKRCLQLYQAECPIITISDWGARSIRGRNPRARIHQVGNGVNFDHFPISHEPKDGSTVLVEGWVPTNATKDVQLIGAQTAKALRSQGYRILAYSAEPLKGQFSSVPHEFHYRPSTEQLNSLYARATILIKASRYDFRACAPVEAMTKGTVTARAITEGDDDLVHEQNCLRGPYNTAQLLRNAQRLLRDETLRLRLSDACYHHVETYTWDYWMQKIENLLIMI